MPLAIPSEFWHHVAPVSQLRPALLLVLVSFTLGVLFTELARRTALRCGIVATPTADRWHRNHPIPLLGGVGVAVAFLTAGLCFDLFPTFELQVLMVSAAAMCAVGLWDDCRQLQPQSKFVAQALLSLLLLAAGFRLSSTGLPLLDVPLTLLWLVGITNALNLLDNMNGLCGGVAVLAALFRAALFYFDGQPQGALLCLALAGAAAGFLCFNFPAGRIFLGDAGSLFLGFWLAGITLTGHHAFAKNYLALLAIPVLLLLVPILDTTLVTITRRLEGRSVARGGRDHVSHRLVAYGLSDRKAVLLLWGLSSVSGGVALLLVLYGVSRIASLAVLLVLTLCLLGVYLGRFGQRVHVRFRGAARTGGLALTALLDVLLLGAAWHAAWLLRFDGALRGEQLQWFLDTLPELLLIKLAALLIAGVYRRPWKYFGLEDAFTVARAAALGSVAAVLYFFFVYRLAGFSRVIFALDFLLVAILLLAFRATFRILDRLAPLDAAGHRRVLIYPADDSGELALRCILAQRHLIPVGFLDDDPGCSGRRIHSVEIVGVLSEIAFLARRHRVEAIVLAYEAPLATRRMLEAVCRAHGLALLQADVRIDEVSSVRAVPAPEREFAAQEAGS
jgi:UDP-GlcNAc:undecaprenyl-phosphate GlcNAc-1-phosphate transferase